jgi:CheY-like chemotaxis protein
MVAGAMGYQQACGDAAGEGKVVLVVENDEELRECMRHVLEDEGFPTLVADQGRTALAMLRSETQLPEVIVLDLMMPIMSGWDFLASLERDPRLRSIPVVVVAGMPQHIDRERVWRSLRKPIDLDELLEAVREA